MSSTSLWSTRPWSVALRAQHLHFKNKSIREEQLLWPAMTPVNQIPWGFDQRTLSVLLYPLPLTLSLPTPLMEPTIDSDQKWRTKSFLLHQRDQLRHPRLLSLRLGSSSAQISLNRLNCVKDTHISTSLLHPKLWYKGAPLSRLSSSKLHLNLKRFRNFQPVGLFCSLNLGVSGLINDHVSLEYLKEHHKIGDIIEVTVLQDYEFSEQ